MRRKSVAIYGTCVTVVHPKQGQMKAPEDASTSNSVGTFLVESYQVYNILDLETRSPHITRPPFGTTTLPRYFTFRCVT
jgi:hypothetical protein